MRNSKITLPELCLIFRGNKTYTIRMQTDICGVKNNGIVTEKV